MEIVKVQLAACPDDPDRLVIYARGRDRVTLQRVPRRVRETVAARGKRYFTGAWHDGGWAIGDLVPDQGW